jgi:hypothetical protein
VNGDVKMTPDLRRSRPVPTEEKVKEVFSKDIS